MANEIIKYNQLPTSEILSMGKAFAESGMFPDTKQAAQAIVKIQAGQEIGIPPFAAMTGIHIISGKPTIGAGLIASKIKSSGKYDYRVKEMTDTVCSIDFFEGKNELGNSTFTIEDAKKAGTKNLDKFPKNMLFARAISNGVKWFTPDVFNGPVYTPEEMNAEVKTEDVPHEEVPPVYPKETAQKATITRKPSPTVPDEDQVIDQWLQKINDANTIDDLKRVYSEGMKVINNNPKLYAAKEDKKKSFLTPA